LLLLQQLRRSESASSLASAALAHHAASAHPLWLTALLYPLHQSHKQPINYTLYSTTYEPAQKYPQLIFLKELSFRTSDAKHAARVVQEIKVLRSTVLQRDKERAERATLVQQEKLVRGKVRRRMRSALGQDCCVFCNCCCVICRTAFVQV
jgi:hypothetical protein